MHIVVQRVVQRQEFLAFYMDSTILNDMARVLERAPLHLILTHILERPEFKTSVTRTAIVNNAEDLAQFLFKSPEMRLATQEVAFEACTQTLMSEIATMGRKENGWHFSAQKASPEQIEGFSIVDMSRELKAQTPQVWQTLSAMLASDSVRESLRAQYLKKGTSMDPSEMMVDAEGLSGSQASQAWDDEDEYWALDADGEHEPAPEGEEEHECPAKRMRRLGTRNSSLVQVVRVYRIQTLIRY
jgi:hypothetical protein